MQFIAAGPDAEGPTVPRVAALITTILSNPTKLQDAVAAAVAAAEAAGVSFEVICVVNEPRVAMPVLDGCRVLTPGLNLGYAGGLQLARSQTKAELLWVLQDDMTFGPQLLAELLSRLESSSTAGIVAPVMKDPGSNSIQIRGGHFDVARKEQVWHPTVSASQRSSRSLPELNWLSLAGALIPAGAWDAVAGPDPAFFPLQYVDIDFGFRLTAAGYQMLPCLSAAIEHEVGGSSAGLMKRFLNLDADQRMRQKHGSGPGEIEPGSAPGASVPIPPQLLAQVARSASLGFIDFARFANREINLLRADLSMAKGEGLPAELAEELAVANEQIRLRSELEAMRKSISWRVTAPLRWLGRLPAKLLRR